MAEIELKNKGLIALIDDADLPLTSPYHWYAMKTTNNDNWYVCAEAKDPSCKRGRRTISLHRLLLDVSVGQRSIKIDHHNGNTLDNRRNNIRIATPQQNARNVRRIRKDNHSGVKGAHFCKKSGKWMATIYPERGGKALYLGRFTTPAEAGAAYDVAARKLFGDFAATNAEIVR